MNNSDEMPIADEGCFIVSDGKSIVSDEKNITDDKSLSLTMKHFLSVKHYIAKRERKKSNLWVP